MQTRFLLAAATAASVLFGALPAQAQTDATLSQVMELGTNFCPDGTIQASGQLLPVAQYRDLFSLLGARFGGDGKSTFALPVLQPPGPPQGKAMMFCMVIHGMYPRRP